MEQTRSAIDEVTAAAAEELNQVRIAHQAELDQLRAGHKEKIVEMAESNEAEKLRLVGIMDEKTEALEVKHASALSALEEAKETAVANVSDLKDSEIRELTERFNNDLALQKTESNHLASAAASAHQLKLDQSMKELEEALLAKGEADLVALEARHVAKLTEISETHNHELMSKEIEGEKTRAAAVERQLRDHMLEMTALREELHAEREALRASMLEDLRDKEDRLRADLDDRHRQELDRHVARIEAASAQAAELYTARLEDTKAHHAAEIEEIRARSKDDVIMLRKQMEGEQQRHIAELAALKSEHEVVSEGLRQTSGQQASDSIAVVEKNLHNLLEDQAKANEERVKDLMQEVEMHTQGCVRAEEERDTAIAKVVELNVELENSNLNIETLKAEQADLQHAVAELQAMTESLLAASAEQVEASTNTDPSQTIALTSHGELPFELQLPAEVAELILSRIEPLEAELAEQKTQAEVAASELETAQSAREQADILAITTKLELDEARAEAAEATKKLKMAETVRDFLEAKVDGLVKEMAERLGVDIPLLHMSQFGAASMTSSPVVPSHPLTEPLPSSPAPEPAINYEATAAWNQLTVAQGRIIVLEEAVRNCSLHSRQIELLSKELDAAQEDNDALEAKLASIVDESANFESVKSALSARVGGLLIH